MARVSVIIPSRNEQFLVKTVADVLAKAHGDIEVIPVLDGYWERDLPKDPRVRPFHHGEALGMRPSINHAARIATGEYLLKLDGHCMVAPGFDEQLKADHHERNWVVVPRRYALDPENWTIEERSDNKYPIDAHYLSYPYERPGDGTCGMHGTVWTERRDARKDVLLDEEMSSQGSCWFMHREHWDRLGELDIARYGNFIQEMQEIGLKTWLGGGALMVNKATWYAHLYKGRRFGRGYSMDGFRHEEGRDFCNEFWMNDRWPLATRRLRWLIEKFSPVPSWPSDLDDAFRALPSDRNTVAVLAPADRPSVTADGSIDYSGGRVWLAQEFARRGFTRGVEVGTEQGEYAETLCKANPGLHLTCVDAWKAYPGYREHVTQEKLDGFYDASWERLKPFGCTLLRMFSVDAAKRFEDRSLDFVYIDASHRYEQVVADLAAWAPKVRAGGIVSGHDFRHIKGKAGAVFGVVEAVRGWVKAYDISPWFVLRGDKSPSWMWVKEEDSVLRIISAFYGPKADPKAGRDVTALVQRRCERNAISLDVSNETLGGDPAPGQGKKLSVVYGTKGGGSAVIEVREGGTLTLPKASLA